MKIVVGLASTPDCNGNLERCRGGLAELGREFGFELAVCEHSLAERADAEVVARQCAERQVDLVLLLCNSFVPNGDVVLPFAELPAKLGLWALPEPTRQGPLQLTSLVALNLFGSMVHRFRQGRPPHFKWFFGEVSDSCFRRRLQVTVGAIRVIKGLQNAVIGYIGGHAPGFANLQFDAQALASSLGVQVQELPLEAALEEARRCDAGEAREWGERLASRASQVRCSAQDLTATARIALALERVCTGGSFSALAVSCWPRFHQELGVFPCVAYGTLNAAGTIVSCEGDVLGAVTLLCLSLAGRKRPSLMDLVSVLDSENAACFWHCGLATWNLADAQDVRLITRPVGNPDGSVSAAGGFADVTFAAGPVTVARISHDGSKMLLASGEITSRLGPGYEGSGGWVTSLQMLHRPVTPLQLLDTVVRHGVEHHYAITPEDVTDVLLEFAAWLDLGVIEPGEVYDHLPLESRG